MAETSLMSPLQTPAVDFALPDLDGTMVSLDTHAGAPALLVAFLSGDELRVAVARVLAGESVPEPHRPSMGCSIKRKQ